MWGTEMPSGKQESGIDTDSLERLQCLVNTNNWEAKCSELKAFCVAKEATP